MLKNILEHIRFKSFATRLSVYTTVVVALSFSAVIVAFYSYTRQIIVTGTITNTHSTLKKVVAQIEDHLNNANVIALNSQWIIERSLSDPGSLEDLLESIVRNNDGIVGSSIAFCNNYYKDKGGHYMIYSYMKEEGKVSTKIFMDKDKHYDYFDKEWFKMPLQLNHDYWSEPYYDEGAGDMMMTTYSFPLRDKNNNIYAIFTIDISIDQFTQLISSIKAFKSSYLFVLSRKGYYLTHHDDSRIMRETVFTNAQKSSNKDYERIGKDMISGNTGTIEFDNSGEDSYAFYTPITSTGWSVCCVIPANVIFEDLRSITHTIVLFFLLGLVVIFITSFKVINRLIKPLLGFAISAREISKGNFGVELPQVRTHDEVKILRNSLDDMRQSLQTNIDKLTTATASRERIENELKIAREIQMGMIPKLFPPFPDREDIDLHAVLHPAKEVGGDLYDFFIDEEKLYFTIGDVSGKGVPASLFMAIISSLFRTVAIREKNVRRIVTMINNSVCKNNYSNMFVTMIVGILDLKTGDIQMCNAGHNPPVIYEKNKSPQYLQLHHNLPVGIMPNFEYEENSMVFNKETKILLYTDGVTEAEDKDTNLYGENRLLELISKNSDANARNIIEALLHDIALHSNGASQSDDLTIFAINYKPKSF